MMNAGKLAIHSALAALLLGSAAPAAADPQRPNILLILIDDMDIQRRQVLTRDNNNSGQEDTLRFGPCAWNLPEHSRRFEQKPTKGTKVLNFSSPFVAFCKNSDPNLHTNGGVTWRKNS